jgi:hypothetical protein
LIITLDSIVWKIQEGVRSTEFVFAADPAVIVAKGSSTLAMFYASLVKCLEAHARKAKIQLRRSPCIKNNIP